MIATAHRRQEADPSAPKTLLDGLQASIRRRPCVRPTAWPNRSHCFGRTRMASGAPHRNADESDPRALCSRPLRTEERQGPVIWLKCIVERSLPDVSPPPASCRSSICPMLAGRTSAPAAIAPPASSAHGASISRCRLAPAQRPGLDGRSLLTSEQGLGLDIAKDNRTREAMLRALPLLAAEPLVRSSRSPSGGRRFRSSGDRRSHSRSARLDERRRGI